MTQDLAHFLASARSGHYEHASSGEQKAARIAAVLLENVPGLDRHNLQGLKDFADVCAMSTNTAEKWLRERQFAGVE